MPLPSWLTDWLGKIASAPVTTIKPNLKIGNQISPQDLLNRTSVGEELSNTGSTLSLPAQQVSAGLTAPWRPGGTNDWSKPLDYTPTGSQMESYNQWVSPEIHGLKNPILNINEVKDVPSLVGKLQNKNSPSMSTKNAIELVADPLNVFPVGGVEAKILSKGVLKGVEKVGGTAIKEANILKTLPKSQVGAAFGDVVKNGDTVVSKSGQVWKVLDDSDPSSLLVKSEQGATARIGRAQVDPQTSPVLNPEFIDRARIVIKRVDEGTWDENHIPINLTQVANDIGVKTVGQNAQGVPSTGSSIIKDIRAKLKEIDEPKTPELPKEPVEPVKGSEIPPTQETPAVGAGVKPQGQILETPEEEFKRLAKDPRILDASETFKTKMSQEKGKRLGAVNDYLLDNPNMPDEEALGRSLSKLKTSYGTPVVTIRDLMRKESVSYLFKKIRNFDFGMDELGRPKSWDRINANNALVEGLKNKLTPARYKSLEPILGKDVLDSLVEMTLKVEKVNTVSKTKGIQSLQDLLKPKLTEPRPPTPVPEYPTGGRQVDMFGEQIPYGGKPEPTMPNIPVKGNISKPTNVLDPEQTRLIKEGFESLPPVKPGEETVASAIDKLTPKARKRFEMDMGKLGYHAADWLNFPRAILTSYDLSAPGRQGLILAESHPILAAKAFKDMIKSVANPKYAAEIDEMIRDWGRTNGYWARKLDLTENSLEKKTLGGLSKLEESQMSATARKIPGVVRFQQAYTNFLNLMRMGVFEQNAKNMKLIGAKIDDFDKLSELINTASGRGKLPGKLASSSPLLNELMFSPRLVFARLTYPIKFAQAVRSGDRVLRREAVRQMSSFLGAGASIVGLAKLMGAEVEFDPRSSDFAKIKVGNTHVDIWGGYVQYARMIGQLTTFSKKLRSGEITKANAWDLLSNMAQSKASPVAGLAIDLFKGRDFAGREMSVDAEKIRTQEVIEAVKKGDPEEIVKSVVNTQLYNRITPLFLQDMIDSLLIDGSHPELAALSGLGFGAISYEDIKGDTGLQFNSIPRVMDLGVKLGEVPSNISGVKLSDEDQGQYQKFMASVVTPQIRTLMEKPFTLSSSEQTAYGVTRSDQLGKVELGSVLNSRVTKLKDKAKDQWLIVGDVDVPKVGDDDKTLATRLQLGIVSDYLKATQSVTNSDARTKISNFLRAQDPALDVAMNLTGYSNSTKSATAQKNMSTWKNGNYAIPIKTKYNTNDVQQLSKVLVPYYSVEDQVWAKYDPKLRQISDQASKLSGEKRFELLNKYPLIYTILGTIEEQKGYLRASSPLLDNVIRNY
jgi:hypothetical protein